MRHLFWFTLLLPLAVLFGQALSGDEILKKVDQNMFQKTRFLLRIW